ncbi:MAG: magnesium and cobalt transport protein CorA, partial [Candidatus Thorarchaeota archaeon]
MNHRLESKKSIKRPKIIKKRSEKAGLPPGSPVHIGKKKTEEIKISILEYGEEKYDELLTNSIEDCLSFKEKSTVTWIDVEGLHDLKTVEKIGECFNLHPLLLEDILNTDQRPKSDDYDTQLYLV